MFLLTSLHFLHSLHLYLLGCDHFPSLLVRPSPEWLELYFDLLCSGAALLRALRSKLKAIDEIFNTSNSIASHWTTIDLQCAGGASEPRTGTPSWFRITHFTVACKRHKCLTTEQSVKQPARGSSISFGVNLIKSQSTPRRSSHRTQFRPFRWWVSIVQFVDRFRSWRSKSAQSHALILCRQFIWRSSFPLCRTHTRTRALTIPTRTHTYACQRAHTRASQQLFGTKTGQTSWHTVTEIWFFLCSCSRRRRLLFAVVPWNFVKWIAPRPSENGAEWWRHLFVCVSNVYRKCVRLCVCVYSPSPAVPLAHNLHWAIVALRVCATNRALTHTHTHTSRLQNARFLSRFRYNILILLAINVHTIKTNANPK